MPGIASLISRQRITRAIISENCATPLLRLRRSKASILALGLNLLRLYQVFGEGPCDLHVTQGQCCSWHGQSWPGCLLPFVRQQRGLAATRRSLWQRGYCRAGHLGRPNRRLGRPRNDRGAGCPRFSPRARGLPAIAALLVPAHEIGEDAAVRQLCRFPSGSTRPTTTWL